MPRLIDEDKAKEVLTDYYHISTDIQQIAMNEAFSRIPTVEASDIFNKGLLAGLKAAGKNAIPKEWIKKWSGNEPYWSNLAMHLIEDWEKENGR